MYGTVLVLLSFDVLFDVTHGLNIQHKGDNYYRTCMCLLTTEQVLRLNRRAKSFLN